MRTPQRLTLILAAFVAMAALATPAAESACSLRRAKADGGEKWTLENDFLRVVVDPSRAGGVESILYKPSMAPLTIPPERSGGVSFMGRVYRQVREGDKTVIEVEYFNKYTFEARLVANTPKRAALAVTSPGRSPSFAWATFTKVYELREGECALYVRHVLDNGSDKPQRAGLWIMTFIRPRGLFPERVAYYTPAADGVKTIDHPGPQSTEQGDWVRDPAGAWKAVLGKGTRAGMVAIVDYPRLSAMFNWYSKHYTRINSTFEWMIREQEIAPGKRFSTSTTLLPVAGFRRVDGVIGDRVACAISLSKDGPAPGEAVEIDVSLAAARRERVRLETRLLRAGATRAEALLTKSTLLTPGRTRASDCVMAPDAPGAYRVEVSLYQGGKLIGRCSRPVAVGASKAVASIVPPRTQKVGREFLFPVMHMGLPGAKQLKFRRAVDSTAKAARKRGAKAPALSRKETHRQRALKLYGPLPYIEDISGEIGSPHVRWAKPLAGPNLKTLYLVSIRFQVSTTKRGPIELAQRMSTDYRYVPLLNRIVASRGTFGMHADERKPELEPYTMDVVTDELAKPHDVIVVDWLRFKGVQPELTRRLLAAVASGKGLVIRRCWNTPKPILDALRKGRVRLPENFYSVPQVNKRAHLRRQMPRIVRLARHGKGRIAVIESGASRYPCVPDDRRYEYTPNFWGKEFAYWEYMQVPFLKALLWASGRELGATVDGVSYKDGRLQARVAAAKGVNAGFDVTFRDGHNQVEATRRYAARSLKPGANTLPLDLPALPGGFHVAEYRLADAGGRVHDFGALAFETPSPCRIDNVAFAKDKWRADETIRAKVSLTGVPAGCQLSAEAEDVLGRVVFRKDTPLRPGRQTQAVAFRIARPLTALHRLQVRVKQGDRVLAREMSEFSMPYAYPPNDELMAYSWYSQPMGLKRWKDCDFDSVIFGITRPGNGTPKSLANLGLRPFGFSVGAVVGRTAHKGVGHYFGKDLIREPCLSNPDRQRRAREKIVSLMKKGRYTFYGAMDYQMFDEMQMGPCVCSSEHCLAEFRKYLRKRYASLAALNREWSASFANWDAVRPIPVWELDPAKNNMARWLDHRLFMNTVFAQLMVRSKASLQEVNPAATLGMSGTQNPGMTYDWWKLMKVCDCLGNYGGLQEDLIASFRTPRTRNGRWQGGYVPTETLCERYQRGSMWVDLLGGSNGYFFFHGSQGGTSLLGDLRLSDNMKIAVEELRDAKAGLAKLVLSADAASDGVAMHYSQSSLFCAIGTVGTSFWRESLDSWKFVLNDLGLTFRFLASEQIENGALDPRKHKVFILPMSMSISRKETDALRRYVKAGGVVIADYATGLYDGHGRRVNNTLLHEVFGIRRKDSDLRISGCQLKVSPPTAGDPRAGDKTFLAGAPERLLIRFGESGLSLDSARAYGDTGQAPAPALICNRYGRGQTVLLNCAISGYAGTKLGGTGGEIIEVTRGDPAVTTPLRDLIGSLLAGHGVRPAVRLTAAGGKNYQLVTRTFRYRKGPLAYVAVIRPDSRPGKIGAKDYVPVTVDFGRRAHVYDMRKRKYLGHAQRVNTPMASGIAYLYSALPYRVSRVVVSPPRSATAGSAVRVPVRIEASSRTPGDHVVYVRVFGPDGAERKHYALNTTLKSGAGQATIPLALNDPAGPWRVTVRDVSSGIVGEGRFGVR